jgi:hypothetical protein
MIGKCDRNLSEFIATGQKLSLGEQYRRLTGVKGEPPSVRAHYFRDHAGLFWPVLWSGPYIRILTKAICGLLRRKS